MDGGTRARVEEEKALDSFRLRSSARLGFASSSSTVGGGGGGGGSSSCRVARRKRKKRRRQQQQQQQDQQQRQQRGNSNDEDEDLVVPVTGGSDVVLGENSPEADRQPSTGGGGGGGGNNLGEESAGKQSKNRPAVGGAEPQRNPSGGNGTRAAATSVSPDNTLLNRRPVGKRSSRRCNAGARRNAMTMDLQRLITEVHARPAIWDQKNVNYHNRDVILKMWREIGRACEVSTDVAKSKWKHLRDNFRNELKKTYRGKCDGGSNEHDSKWVWFKSLFFLRDQMNSRVIGCALSQNCSAVLRSSPEGTQMEPQIDILEGHEETQFEDLDGDSCQSMLSNDDTLHQVMPPPKLNKIGRKRTLMDAMDNDYAEMDRKRYESLQKRLAIVQEEEEDDTYHFLMSVRNPLKSLPLDRQMFVRLKIQELVYNEINSQNQQQQRAYETSQDVKPPRACNSTAGVAVVGGGGTDGGGISAGGGEIVSDMSNPASVLQNCTTEGSSDDAFFG